MKKVMIALSLIAATAGGAAAVALQGNGNITGLWSTGRQGGRVELYRCGAAICRKVNDAAPLRANPDQRDVKNPDPALRSRKIIGLEFVHGFKPSDTEPGTYEGGKIYNAEDGETYSARIKLENPDKLVLRGYVLMPMLGKSQTWTRVK